MTQSKPFEIQAGNTTVPLEAYLQRRNMSNTPEACPLSGKTVTFTMINKATGAEKVSSQSATVVTAATGHVRYAWSSTAEVNVAGIYRTRWDVTDTGKVASFPVNPVQCEVWIHSATQTAEEAYRAALES